MGPVYINTTSTICLLYVRDSKVQQLGGDLFLPHTSDECRIFFWGCDTRGSKYIRSIRDCVGRIYEDLTLNNNLKGIIIVECAYEVS
ncbi:hypothetical protein BH18THE2_BH18THE2_17130 [soil metagenome]